MKDYDLEPALIPYEAMASCTHDLIIMLFSC